MRTLSPEWQVLFGPFRAHAGIDDRTGDVGQFGPKITALLCIFGPNKAPSGRKYIRKVIEIFTFQCMYEKQNSK